MDRNRVDDIGSYWDVKKNNAVGSVTITLL